MAAGGERDQVEECEEHVDPGFSVMPQLVVFYLGRRPHQAAVLALRCEPQRSLHLVLVD